MDFSDFSPETLLTIIGALLFVVFWWVKREVSRNDTQHGSIYDALVKLHDRIDDLCHKKDKD